VGEVPSPWGKKKTFAEKGGSRTFDGKEEKKLEEPPAEGKKKKEREAPSA